MVNASEHLSNRFRTSFVGRAREREALARSLTSSRLTVVTGPGGVGKTRLVFTIADEVRESFPDGVFQVSLDDVSAASVLCAAVSGAVGMRDSDSTTWSDLSRFLLARRILLVIDGCELLDTDCLLALQDLLESTDGLTIAATTRRFLHVDGAVSMTLAPLPVPPAEDGMSGEAAGVHDAQSYDSVRFFAARAQLVRPDFAVTTTNAASVAMLCRRLDGLPLALELAAPWVRALSIEQIVARMDQLPDFPRAGSGAVSPRHQTLSSLVEGTYELCSEAERLLWSRTAVFSGSFDLDAVEALCSAPPLDPARVVDVLASLLDQSVLVVDDDAGPSRYRMLRISRDYVTRHAAKVVEAMVERHRAYYASVVDRGIRHWSGPGQIRLLRELELDYANILAAIDAGLQHAESAVDSARMASDLWVLWFIDGRLSEGRSVLARVAASRHLDAGDVHRVRAMYLNGYLCVLQGQIRSAQKIHEIATSSDTGTTAINAGLRLHVAAMIEMGQEDVHSATGLLSEAIDVYNAQPDPRARILALDALGIAVLLAGLDGESARADALGARGLAECDELGDVVWRGYIAYALGVDGWMRGDHDRARREAVSVLGSSPDQLLATHCVELLAWCAAKDRHLDRAAKLLGAADHRWEHLGGHYSGFWGLSVHRQRCLDETRAGLGASGYAAAYTAGRRLGVEDVIGMAATDTESTLRDREMSETPLTTRELEVARLLADGRSNREIAAALTISPRTAESHVDHILTKLDLVNRTQVATWVVERAWRPRTA